MFVLAVMVICGLVIVGGITALPRIHPVERFGQISAGERECREIERSTQILLLTNRNAPPTSSRHRRRGFGAGCDRRVRALAALWK